MRRIFLIISIVVFFLLYIYRQWPDHDLHIVFCDVGQGDATLIYSGFTQVLIDGGRDASVLNCLDTFMPFGDKNIEVVVATHPDADHIGGLAGVFRQYSIDLLLMNTDSKKTNDFSEFQAAVSRKEKEKTKIRIAESGDQLHLNANVLLKVVSPQVSSSQNVKSRSLLTETNLWDSSSADLNGKDSYNNRSIVLFLIYGKMSAVLTGDLEEPGEVALVETGMIKQSTILKVGHHGSKTSSSQPFLTQVRPEISVVSSGKNNSYGHPHLETIQRLAQIGTQILRTDQLGNIHFASDGQNLWQL